MKKSIAYILVALLIAVAGIGLGVSAFNNANNNKPNTEVQGDNNDANVSDEDFVKQNREGLSLVNEKLSDYVNLTEKRYNEKKN